MKKIWTSFEKKDTSVVIAFDDVIYLGKVKKEEIEGIVLNFELNIVSTKLFSLPISYINEISMNEQSKVIELLFKGSKEEIIISNVDKRNEVFDFFKTIKEGIEYSIINNKKIQTAKKPLIAFFVSTALFLWTLYLANEIEYGSEYEVVGSNSSISGIVLGLAQIGVINVCLIFIPLIIIALLH